MSDEIVFRLDDPDDASGAVRERSPFLAPGVCAVAAFALAATALLGQNVLALGIQVRFGPALSPDDGILSYYLVIGLAAGAQALLALPLGLWGLRAEAAWEVNLARAAVLISVVPLLSCAATIIGAIVHGDSLD
jgi:hypothetical protein